MCKTGGLKPPDGVESLIRYDMPNHSAVAQLTHCMDAIPKREIQKVGRINYEGSSIIYRVRLRLGKVQQRKQYLV